MPNGKYKLTTAVYIRQIAFHFHKQSFRKKDVAENILLPDSESGLDTNS